MDSTWNEAYSRWIPCGIRGKSKDLHLVTDPGRDIDFQAGKAQENQYMDLQSEGLLTDPMPINNGESADGDRERLIQVHSDHDNFY